LPSTVIALAAAPHTNTAYAASSSRIITGDIKTGISQPLALVSNSVFHIHTLEKELVLLEVRHALFFSGE
jgi:hypothetical protein